MICETGAAVLLGAGRARRAIYSATTRRRLLTLISHAGFLNDSILWTVSFAYGE
jgi:hypothetical protein